MLPELSFVGALFKRERRPMDSMSQASSDQTKDLAKCFKKAVL